THALPHCPLGDGRAGPRRAAHPRAPADRAAVPRRLREPVPRGPPPGRPTRPEADPGVEGETRGEPSKGLNAEGESFRRPSSERREPFELPRAYAHQLSRLAPYRTRRPRHPASRPSGLSV